MSESEILDHVDSLLGDGSSSKGGGVKWMLVALILAAVGGGIGVVVMRGGASAEPAVVARRTPPPPPLPVREPAAGTDLMAATDHAATVDPAAPGAVDEPSAEATTADERMPRAPAPTTLTRSETPPAPVERAPVTPAPVEPAPVELASASTPEPARPAEERRSRPVSTPAPTPTAAASSGATTAFDAGSGADEAPRPATDLVASLSRPTAAAVPPGPERLPLDRPTPEVMPFVESAMPTSEPPAPVVRTPAVRRGDLVDLSEVDAMPAPVERPAPEYDPFARRLRQHGTVTLRVLVNERGEVGEAELIEGIPRSRLNDAALAGVRAWTYRPATKDGVPVSVWIVESVLFRL